MKAEQTTYIFPHRKVHPISLAKCDDRPDNILEELRSHLESQNMDEAVFAAEQVIKGLNRLLLRTMETHGFNQRQFSKLIGCAPPELNKCLFKFNGTRSPSLRVLPNISEQSGSSITAMMFKYDNLPLVLPQKHCLWLDKTSKYDEETMLAIAANIASKYNNCDDDDDDLPAESAANLVNEKLVGRRIADVAVSYGVSAIDCADNIFHAFGTLKPILFVCIKDKIFSGRIPTLCILAALMDCALDYFILPDYSNYSGSFCDPDRNEINLTLGQRAVLSAILNAPEENELEIIGTLCAGGFRR